MADSNAATTPEVAAYALKVDSLRKRLEGVDYTMTRVKVRLESLQAAVTKFEMKASATSSL